LNIFLLFFKTIACWQSFSNYLFFITLVMKNRLLEYKFQQAVVLKNNCTQQTWCGCGKCAVKDKHDRKKKIFFPKAVEFIVQHATTTCATPSKA
jgi:hypothetical protein